MDGYSQFSLLSLLTFTLFLNIATSYVVKTPDVTLLSPSGLRFDYPGEPGISLVSLHVNINKQLGIPGNVPADINVNTIKNDTSNAWSYTVQSVTKGDKVYYWIGVVYAGLEYDKYYLSWPAEYGLNITTFAITFPPLRTAASSFVVQTPVVSALSPTGIRFDYPDQDGVTLVSIHFNINKRLGTPGNAPADINANLDNSSSIAGVWTYSSQAVLFNAGDTVYYWVGAVYNGLEYDKFYLNWTAPGGTSDSKTSGTTLSGVTPTVTNPAATLAQNETRVQGLSADSTIALIVVLAVCIPIIVIIVVILLCLRHRRKSRKGVMEESSPYEYISDALQIAPELPKRPPRVSDEAPNADQQNKINDHFLWAQADSGIESQRSKDKPYLRMDDFEQPYLGMDGPEKPYVGIDHSQSYEMQDGPYTKQGESQGVSELPLNKNFLAPTNDKDGKEPRYSTGIRKVESAPYMGLTQRKAEEGPYSNLKNTAIRSTSDA